MAMTIYEQCGRLLEKFENELAAHLSTLDMVRRLKAGEVSLDQLTIGKNADGLMTWAIVPAAAPATPAPPPE